MIKITPPPIREIATGAKNIFVHVWISWFNELHAKLSGLSHTELDDIGTNTHTQVDTHIADSTIHYVNPGFMEDVVDDTTPQLGGDIDVNGSDIISVSDGDINIYPNGTGVLNTFDIVAADTEVNHLEIKNSLTENTVRVATTPYNVLTTDLSVFVDTDGAAITVNLPAGSDGRFLRIKNTGSSGNDVTVTPDGSEDLLGANSSQLLADEESVDLEYETTEGWWA